MTEPGASITDVPLDRQHWGLLRAVVLLRYYCRLAAAIPGGAGATRPAVRLGAQVAALGSSRLGRLLAHLFRLLPRFP